ncbi:xylose isomerase [Mucilaginibacter pallidiroseus]|uniref:Xylose isomerase n=1 Tax=Mucilaginibacter pallidiroseus TaxID=2599295 RepID=A0A563UBY1_9SPHI|nr:metabolite traffic protein EboE [Mucilaginibacter pallidiroseus]TWR28881.1 xylose isomerase [Mucilaginibacter pallidiroseus]
MEVLNGHLTYCTNIYPGETWTDHFFALKHSFSEIKSHLCPNTFMGIGLRLSNIASVELLQETNLNEFKSWLQANNAYVFTMNGFPYGGFHNVVVKDQVHAPDWTTLERIAYTSRLFKILGQLLPDGIDGGISTSPLSYKYWFDNEDKSAKAKQAATVNIIKVLVELYEIHINTGKLLHLDIEPEPDGLLETGREFIEWFEKDLLPLGIGMLKSHFNITETDASTIVKRHINLCYDICHFAIGYEPHQTIIEELNDRGIKVGKIQISAALKAIFNNTASTRNSIHAAFQEFDEPTYLHQVIARQSDGGLQRYADLPLALEKDTDALEWRAHFHVPIFLEDFGLLQSTQEDIKTVLSIQREKPFTNHLEVETYTWGVLPEALKAPLDQSVIRELQWVKSQFS